MSFYIDFPVQVHVMALLLEVMAALLPTTGGVCIGLPTTAVTTAAMACYT